MSSFPYAELLKSNPDAMVAGATLIGALVGGLASALVTYAFARNFFRSKVLDFARREIKEPLSAYAEWLTALAGEFSLWKNDLLPAYLGESSQDQFELNRMRKLFVDQRNTMWFAKLEEYEVLLAKFKSVIKALWIRQTELGEGFHQVFKYLETDPPEAVKAGARIETLAFEQTQLVIDLLYQLQYECLRTVASGKPRAPKDLVKPRIVRMSFGRIRLVSPQPMSARIAGVDAL